MHQEQVTAISPGAARSGVRVGMRIGGVSAIAPGTVILERGLEKEALLPAAAAYDEWLAGIGAKNIRSRYCARDSLP